MIVTMRVDLEGVEEKDALAVAVAVVILVAAVVITMSVLQVVAVALYIRQFKTLQPHMVIGTLRCQNLIMYTQELLIA
jgi:hypothetical protein